MGLVSFYRNPMKSSYNFGRNTGNKITRDMPSKGVGRVGEARNLEHLLLWQKTK